MRFPKIFWGSQNCLGFQDPLRFLPSEMEPGGAQGSQDIFGLRDFWGPRIFGFPRLFGLLPSEEQVPIVPIVFGSQDFFRLPRLFGFSRSFRAPS